MSSLFISASVSRISSLSFSHYNVMSHWQSLALPDMTETFRCSTSLSSSSFYSSLPGAERWPPVVLRAWRCTDRDTCSEAPPARPAWSSWSSADSWGSAWPGRDSPPLYWGRSPGDRRPPGWSWSWRWWRCWSGSRELEAGLRWKPTLSCGVGDIIMTIYKLTTWRRRRRVSRHDDRPDNQAETAEPNEAHHDWFPSEATTGVLLGHSIPVWGGRELLAGDLWSWLLTVRTGRLEASWHRLLSDRTVGQDSPPATRPASPSPELTSRLSLSLSLSCLPTLTTVHCLVYFLQIPSWAELSWPWQHKSFLLRQDYKFLQCDLLTSSSFSSIL